MKAEWLAGALISALMFIPPPVSAQTTQTGAQDKGTTPAKNADNGSASAKESEPLPQVPRITAEEVQRLLKANTKIVLVDTDDSIAYDAEHIKGAVNIAYDPTVDPQDRQATLGSLPGDRLIVFYCNCSHEEDSAPFVLEMWQLGYEHEKVKALKGGLTRWEQLGYPLAGTDVNASKEKGN